METIKIGMADLGIAKAPDRLRTTGLGSCVGVVLYDPMKQLAGMAHVMLPDSTLGKISETVVGKYADTALPELLKQMEHAGANIKNLICKMAGGAQMFTFKSGSDTMRIGPRNVEACKAFLQKMNIRIVAEETGGNCGRTIEMDAGTGILHIRTVNQPAKEV